jgi:hydroxypyruvate isomerase
MPRFSANLSMLFTELPLIDRFAAAKAAGFDAVEVQLPYGLPAEDIAAKLNENDLEMVLINLPAGDWDKGERGIACLPDRRDEFATGIPRALEYAKALRCPRINCLAGIVPLGLSREAAHVTLVENLKVAAPLLAAEGIDLLVEPINACDIPGFAVTYSAEAIQLFDRVGAANLRLQYDVYHMQRTEGELAATIARLLARIGHIQVADNPGRHEPGTGEINYPWLFRYLDRIGYAGWVGAEYKPKTTTAAGLGWLATATLST